MDTRTVVAGEYKGNNQQMDISRQIVFVCRVIIKSRHANMPTACRVLVLVLASKEAPDGPT